LATARWFIRTIGRSSTGIRMSFEHGFTSGKLLEYVYRNRPSGRGLIGPAIDRWFLGHRGWEAVRVRRRHLEQLMAASIDALRKEGRAVSLLDIASGPAAYVLAVLERCGGSDVTARCQDLDERWLQEGRDEAARRGLSRIVFERGNAFDREALLSLRPRPNLAVASGFYDWITEDETVRNSLAMLCDALEPGGRLVLTNQVAHPDLELVSAVFVDFNGQPLRMKMRPAAEVRRWGERAGFVVERTLTDPWGYYAVMTLRKPSAQEAGDGSRAV